MDKCSQDPPLFQLHSHQAASCYLLDGHPVIAPEKLSDLLPA
jgi:hypothetical protein